MDFCILKGCFEARQKKRKFIHLKYFCLGEEFLELLVRLVYSSDCRSSSGSNFKESPSAIRIESLSL